VLTAFVGAATYVEPAAAGPVTRTYSASFPRMQGTGPSGHGDTQDSQAGSATLTLNITNLTSAAFMFTFNDNPPPLTARSPAGATFRVTSPEGNSSQAVCPPGGSMTATVQFSMICVPPQDMVITAGSESEAGKMAAAKNTTSETGMGDWTIEITVQRDWATPIHRPGGSISWSVNTKVERYSLQVTELLRA